VLLHLTFFSGDYFNGDLGHLARRFVDFLAAGGASWWQTLPTNPADPAGSPYSTASSFAGEPLLIDLEDLIARGLLKRTELGSIVGDSPRKVNYPAARKFRLAAHKTAYNRAKSSTDLLKSAAFKKFRTNQHHWLPDYALFMALAKKYGTCDWTCWPQPFKQRQKAAMVAAAKELADDIAFVEFQQFIYDQQWLALRDYAASRKVRLIGDIPIFVSHQSADVWSHQNIFCLKHDGKPEVVAGCPPDRFNAKGQLWGNALYNWKALKSTGYEWWIARFERLLEHFDLIRLDHFIGFYRYWAVPSHARTAVRGKWRYTPGNDFFETAIRRLRNLPLIAEDLGLVTTEVVQLRERFGFPGMRIVQFGFSSGADADHHKPHQYQIDSVVYTGTHDNETALGYLERIKKESRTLKKGAHNELQTACSYLGIEPRNLNAGPAAMIRTAFASVSSLAIIPMQDLLGLPASHRMNVPGTSSGNWTWRCLQSEVSPQLAKQLLQESSVFGRSKWRP